MEPQNKDQATKAFNSLIKKSLPFATKETNNIRYGIVQRVDVNYIDAKIISTGEIIKKVFYQKGVTPKINDPCLIISPDPKNKFQNFAVIFGSSNLDTNKFNARAYLSSNLNNLAHQTWTQIPLDNTNFNVGSFFDADSGNFTIPTDGYYLLSAMIVFINTIANVEYNAVIRVDNAVAFIGSLYMTTAVSTYTPVPPSLAFLMKGQVVNLWGRVNGAVADTVDVIGGTYYTFLSVTLI